MPNTIKTLTNLEFLDLEFNHITTVGECAFCNLTKLKIVTIAFNPLSYIHENAFGAITNGAAPQLELFSVKNCELQILPEKMLDWKNVKNIQIVDNPFTCNCSMAWLINDLKAENPLYKQSLKGYLNRGSTHVLRCSSPPSLAGTKFYNLAGHFCKNDTEDHEIEDDSHVDYVCGSGATSK